MHSRWYETPSVVIDLEDMIAEKLKSHHHVHVVVYNCLVYRVWMGVWMPVRAVLKCW